MKTICLFAGYDKNGIIDDYVIYYIKKLAEFSDVYYCGDFIPKKGELEKLKELTKEAFAFRHKKYDYGSWDELIKKISWEKIEQYDQLILANDSCYGPLFPFEELFNKMEKKECDFWGLSCGKGYHIHIQSFFLVFRKSILKSNCIPLFLSNVKEQPSLKDVCEYYEDQFTYFLRQNGYKYTTYIPYGELKMHPYYETWNCIKEKRFPLLKVKVFNGEVGYDSVKSWKKFLLKYTSYNPNLIVNNLHNRGYSDKEIDLAVKHWKKKRDLKKSFTFLKSLPKRMIKGMLNPIYSKIMYRLDKRFLENKNLLKTNFDDLKKQINFIENKIDLNTKSHDLNSKNSAIYDFFKKYQLVSEQKLEIKISKKNIAPNLDNKILSEKMIIESYNILNFIKSLYNISFFQNERINLLLCGNINEKIVMRYILTGCNVTLLNNNKIDKNSIEYELVKNNSYDTNMANDFCIYQNKKVYFFDLIIVNEITSEIEEGELLTLLYNFSKNMFEESLLIISIPHKSNVMEHFTEILEEVELYWNHSYQEILEKNFSNMENSNCLVLMKKIKE